MARYFALINAFSIFAVTMAACNSARVPSIETSVSSTTSVTVTAMQRAPTNTIQPSTTQKISPTQEETITPEGRLLFGSLAEDGTAGTSIYVLAVSCAFSPEGCEESAYQVADGSEGVNNDNFSWSPDGQLILFLSDRGRRKVHYGTYGKQRPVQDPAPYIAQGEGGLESRKLPQG